MATPPPPESNQGLPTTANQDPSTLNHPTPEITGSHLQSTPQIPPQESTPSPLALDSPLPDPIFTTSSLSIRAMHPQDAPSQYHHASPPSIARYMTLAFPSPYTLSSAETWITLNNPPGGTPQSPSPGLNYAVTPLSDPSTVIGGIGLKPGSDIHAHTAEIGYWLSEEWSGRGLGTELLTGMTKWVFSGGRPEFRRLWAGVMEGNEGSKRVLEKSGYVFEGRMRGHVEKWGEVKDLIVLGILKREWEEREREKTGEGK